ncbi:hypothetical protein PR048_025592 [Dryococelus australis]|uniref:Uncharacterized protein n=1 Tax=Dryococelus australis TaxID=614101 RepID=A0ABQ9GRQ4_9NEOP|nr:hypothetical protein PR048_025592 [Dryococelus australis]
MTPMQTPIINLQDILQRNLIFVSETDSTDSEGEEIISEKLFCKPFDPNTEIDIKSPINIFLQFMTIAFMRSIVDQ